jgi:hypothetical protein
MMIALAILAMGLLVIGAALPIGMRYTRASINMATGEAAAEYALDTIEQNVAIPRTICDSTGAVVIREPGLFVPRYLAHPPDPNGTFAKDPTDPKRDYEPVIKVRPLFTQNILAGSNGLVLYDPSLSDQYRRAIIVEELSRAWLLTWLLPAVDSRECDPTFTSAPWSWLHPALPSVASVYPPISPDAPFDAAYFLLSAQNKYLARFVSPSESRKAMDQRTVATSFYRRVSYAAGSDPFLYELITVVVRVPSAKHRFPVQAPTLMGDQSVLGYAGWQYDCAFPMPWLVYFDVQSLLPSPPGGFDSTTGFPLPPNSAAPATLQFYCAAPQSSLFPVGAIFIPARNDGGLGIPSGVDPPVRFSPPPLDLYHSPDILPIYEVVERVISSSLNFPPPPTLVVAKFNGYYPLQGSLGSYKTLDNPATWPVWVIPPAFEELDGFGQPVFPDRSPIVAVARRYVRLREVP